MVQVGTPREIFDTPANRFVAQFMGVGNLWHGRVLQDGLSMELAALGTVRLAAAMPPGPAVLGVRAERLRIGAVPGANQLTGVAERTIYAGDTVTHSVRLRNDVLALITEPAHGAACPEGSVTISFPPAAGMAFPS